MPEAPGLTILGLSVRALVQSARDTGRTVTGVDCFADTDTRDASDRLYQAEGRDADALAEAALGSADSGQGSELIVGGGLDARPDILRRLNSAFRVRGNLPETAEVLAEPGRLFGLLDDLQIPYPDVCHRRPKTPEDWLVKRTDSCGGLGVNGATTARDLGPSGYFQRRVSGQVLSVLFAADGRDARVIGYSRVFSEARPGRPFGYAGAIGGVDLDADRQGALWRWVRELTLALGLRGVNGIDLVLRSGDGVPLLLEINARPTATLELHENRLSRGGVQCHLDACDGRLPQLAPASGVRGARVVYARSCLTISSHRWPGGCADLPQPGIRLRVGDPVCTVHAAGAHAGPVQRLLAERARFVLESINLPSARAA